ncbi:MAG: hypothetical protein CMP11_08495 [Zetaproteobacteria bacterium]|nr:hypothetical protein [Pseudobdellovibrionaceae bacterium]
MNIKNQVKVKISSIANGGKGISYHQDKIVFVSNAIPGDEANVEIIKESPKWLEAKLLEIPSNNPKREKAKCTIYNDCGGCQWLGVDYNFQTELKKSVLEDIFKKIAKHPLPSNFKLIKSPKTLNYRNKVTLRGQIDVKGQIHLGFFKKNTRTQIHTRHCSLASDNINDFIDFLYSQKIKGKEGKFRLEIRDLPYEKKQNLFVTLHAVEIKELEKKFLSLIKQNKNVLWAGTPKELNEVPLAIQDKQSQINYHTHPAAFEQINTGLNHELRTIIKTKILDLKVTSVLDLYCGSGNLSLALSNFCKFVVGLEVNKKSVDIANFNVKKNRLKNISYKAVNVKKYLEKEIEKCQIFDAIILDPPRKGIKEDLLPLLKIAPKYLFYVSCDPATLARDIKTLKTHYDIDQVYGFDFFPQTYHLETLTIFKKK